MDIIKQFGSLEQAIEQAAEIKRKTYRESLQNNKAMILLSKKLVTIRCDAPVNLNISSMEMKLPQNETIRHFTQNWSLLR